MQGNKEFWSNFWNNRAQTDTKYGRESWSISSFYILIHDISNALKLSRDDAVLDAGGGAGDLAIAISPFVKEITLFDYAGDVVNKAKENTAPFPNITVIRDDITTMSNVVGQFGKIIVGSVIQYLDDYTDIEKALCNIHRCLNCEGKVLFTHNPDLDKKAEHISSYAKLDWDQERIKEALEIEEKRFWTDKRLLSSLAKKIGFSESYESPINPQLWQSTHMFDLVLVK